MSKPGEHRISHRIFHSQQAYSGSRHLRLKAPASIMSVLVSSFLVFSSLHVANAEPSIRSDTQSANVEQLLSADALYPPEKTVKQTIKIGSKALNYRVTVGAIPVLDKSGRQIAAVTFTAYLVDEKNAVDRPITFAMNGGPGSASAIINMLGIGPKRVAFDRARPGLSRLEDNAHTWLPFTDLVFIDPVGTGFSRSFLPPADSQKAFFTYDSDITYLSQFIFDWLQRYGRMKSEKHLVGESYSGYRAPRILEELQNTFHIPFSGLVLISPLMNQDQSRGASVLTSPTPWIASLVTASAAELERRGVLSPSNMAPIEEYARTDYAATLLEGWRNEAALKSMIERLAQLTGLSKTYLRSTGGRIEPNNYLREIYRNDGLLANYYDITLKYPEPFRFPNYFNNNFNTLTDNSVPDPTPDMITFLTEVVGWKPKWPYLSRGTDVSRAFIWARGTDEFESYSSLRRLLAQNATLKVLLTHGYSDIACPYFADVMAVDQIPPMAGRDRVRTPVYPGGHVFYSRPESLSAFTRDAAASFGMVNVQPSKNSN